MMNKNVGKDIPSNTNKKQQKSIDLIISSTDIRELELAVSKFIETFKSALIKFSGPIPLTIKRKRWTVRTSPHVNKDAMQTFERVLRRRLIKVPRSAGAIAALRGLSDISPMIRITLKGMEGL